MSKAKIKSDLQDIKKSTPACKPLSGLKKEQLRSVYRQVKGTDAPLKWTIPQIKDALKAERKSTLACQSVSKLRKPELESRYYNVKGVAKISNFNLSDKYYNINKKDMSTFDSQIKDIPEWQSERFKRDEAKYIMEEGRKQLESELNERKAFFRKITPIVGKAYEVYEDVKRVEGNLTPNMRKRVRSVYSDINKIFASRDSTKFRSNFRNNTEKDIVKTIDTLNDFFRSRLGK